MRDCALHLGIHMSCENCTLNRTNHRYKRSFKSTQLPIISTLTRAHTLPALRITGSI